MFPSLKKISESQKGYMIKIEEVGIIVLVSLTKGGFLEFREEL